MKKYLFYSVFIHLLLFASLFLILIEFGLLSFDSDIDSGLTHVSVYHNQRGNISKKPAKKQRNSEKSIVQKTSEKVSSKVASPPLTPYKKSSITKKKYKIGENSSNISIEDPIVKSSLKKPQTGDKNYNDIQGGSENNEAKQAITSARPEYGNNPKPVYPMVARRRGYEGEVVFNVHVLDSGKVGEMELVKTSGYSVLDNSAHNALREWKFVPGKSNGKYVASWVKVPILFRLNDT